MNISAFSISMARFPTEPTACTCCRKKISTLQKVGANLMARQLETAQSKALLTWRMRFIDPERPLSSRLADPMRGRPKQGFGLTATGGNMTAKSCAAPAITVKTRKSRRRSYAKSDLIALLQRGMIPPMLLRTCAAWGSRLTRSATTATIFTIIKNHTEQTN
ncbi:polynucleotide kinase [Klebsiella phage vB_KshKPC-M]|nr:polynucleotide kinase [Klebsiella phage vB_KshKPC-M]